MRRWLCSIALCAAPSLSSAQSVPAPLVREPPYLPSHAAQAQSDARVLSASPDAPTLALAWRGALRGTVGARIPIVAPLAGTGFLLQLPALIELHNNDTSQPVPWQYWRGRLALEAIYRADVRLGAIPAALSGSLALEHESDHESFGSGAAWARFVYLNSVAVRGDLTLALGLHSLTFAAIARAHVLTCTRNADECGRLGGGVGDATFESQFDVVFDGTIVPNRPYRLFVALHGAWLARNARAATERRLSLDAGFTVRATDRGMFQLYLSGFVGNDVGLFRGGADVAQFGAGFRWGF